MHRVHITPAGQVTWNYKRNVRDRLCNLWWQSVGLGTYIGTVLYVLKF
jgi:hypothetical protein